MRSWRPGLATTDVLKLLLAILENQPSREDATGLQAVPVLVEDLSSYRELIETITEYAEGVFLDAGSYAGEIASRADPSLSVVVSDTMQRVLRSGGEKLAVNVVQETPTASYVEIDGERIDAASSQGQRTLAGVVGSLFDSRLETTSLAVVTYREIDLDNDVADAVWNLFTEQLSGIALASLRTLVVLVENSKVSYRRHCSSGLSVAFRLHSQGLEKRKSWSADKANILRLQPREDELIVLFLGAGFSASSELPLGDELRNTALRDMYGFVDEPYPVLARQFFEAVSSDNRLLDSETGMSLTDFAHKLTLERVLREELFHHDISESPTLLKLRDENARAVSAPGRAVRALGNLTEHRRNIVLVTVNFDTLVEVSGQVEVFDEDEAYKDFPGYLSEYHEKGGLVPLLKLHGTLEKLSTIVATVDETALGLSDAKIAALQALLPEDGRTRCVYVGYSMRDHDVTKIIGTRPFGERLDEFWVSPFLVKTAQEFVEDSRNYGTRPNFWQRSITQTADAFFHELREYWRAE